MCDLFAAAKGKVSWLASVMSVRLVRFHFYYFGLVKKSIDWRIFRGMESISRVGVNIVVVVEVSENNGLALFINAVERVPDFGRVLSYLIVAKY